MSAPVIRTRFAPSPNGSLHLGHAYAAIVAHDRALDRAADREGGEFLLRIEDIDGARSRADIASEFRDDMAWLGLPFREVAPQSSRIASYRGAFERLRAMGLVYPCRCTRAEIEAAFREEAPGSAPVYPGTCRQRPGVDPGPGAAWRIDSEKAIGLTGPLRWDDELAGEQSAEIDEIGDAVLWRKDAPSSYHLAVVVDDAADGITHVTRGLDLFRATSLHRLLQALLGLPVPVWHHHGLLMGDDGRKLAKRRQAPSLAERRRNGEDGKALADALRAHDFPAGISLSQTLDF